MKANDDFLPQGYETPQGNKNYAKIEKGENKFRILSKPIIGWLDWKDKKPLRFEMENKPSQPIDATKPIRHFWAMVVWNYKEQSVQILEITQKSIMAAISNLIKDEDYGSPLNYDLKITRNGDGLESEYSVVPAPPEGVAPNILSQYQSMIIDINALYTGGDPFALSGNKTNENAPF